MDNDYTILKDERESGVESREWGVGNWEWGNICGKGNSILECLWGGILSAQATKHNDRAGDSSHPSA